ncbi:uncharacterized protein C6orf136 homolog [Cuculus canorus]|uniref:uncharacterized protein C6orf136 homolog n=1 Tax=Cuculus canorus TaxID=55661 RepID=UPI0023AA8505|nr:uncharacterized protein C6orf136 homolog [Cuculus canorus]
MRVGGASAAAQAQSEEAPARGEARRSRGGQVGGGTAMYRHGRAAAAAVSRLRPATPLCAWAPHSAHGAAPDPPRRRYRARPQPLPPCPPAMGQPLCPPAGLEVTMVDGEREDDIAVRDPPGPPVLLLRPTAAPHGEAPAPHTPPPSMDEHLALMHQKLQHELPNFLLKVPDYSLYAPDVEFIHRPLRLRTRGRALYAVALALCRALLWGYFAGVRLEVLALTRHREDGSVRARWRLTGVPLPLLLLRGLRRDKSHLLRSYDAFSTFFLNSQGLIRCHYVDKVMPAPTALPEPKKLLVAAAVTVALAEPGVRLALKPSATSGDT